MDRYRISELADRVGVPATTLRYYERQGLLPAQRTGAGYRTYDDHDVERMQFITAAKKLGLPLDRIRELLGIWQAGVCRDVRDRLRPLVDDQLDQLDRQITDLHRFRDSLTTALARLDALPSRDTPCDPACLFLTSTHTTPSPGPPPMSPEPNPPVTCTLTTTDYDQRTAQWRDVLRGTRAESTADSAVRTTLPLDRLRTLAELVAAESRCCPFLTFHLTITADGIRLDTTAPTEARPLLHHLFGEDTPVRSAC